MPASDGLAPARRAVDQPQDSRSGARIARCFQIALALVFLSAWTSLGSQLSVLVGKRGLLPAADFMARVAEHPEIGWLQAPTLFRFGASDPMLELGTWVGILCSLGALLGLWPRLCFALSTLLYLSYCVVARSFLAFQWDNLLLECGLLATLLPSDRPRPWIHTLLRLLLFKLYFESGISKYESVAHDWLNGSAMMHYYETAPLPTALALWFHHLPAWWHHFESWATLVLEIGLPLFVFGPRPARLLAAVGFTAFQLLDIATANYGFFCYLALALHLFLLGERDVARARRVFGRIVRRLWRKLGPRGRDLVAWMRLAHVGLIRLRAAIAPARLLSPGNWRPFWTRWSEQARTRPGRQASARLRRALAVAFSATYVGLSVETGLRAFLPDPPQLGPLGALRSSLGPLRLVNVYHLFAHVTVKRYEPDFQLWDGARWRSYALYYKPGGPMRAPPFVAPHQPRVDFLLWFYGLGMRVSRDGRAFPPPMPDYVQSLLRSLCLDPSAVQPLFVDPLPPDPIAVRVVFWDTHFVSLERHRETGEYWRRTELTHTRSFLCRSTSRPPPRE